MADQPFSLLKNLAKAETSPTERADGKLSFVGALQTMGITSVFDIVRRPKPAFVRELFKYSDANGDLAYENAKCYATQIVRLYRNQLVSSGRRQKLTKRTGVRSLVDIGPSFPNLFKENWDLFCKVGAIEAKDSPAAYLASLYRFALEELEGSDNESNRIHLHVRRPDLKDLLIDQQSTFKSVPTLEIVNKVLSKAIDAYVDTVDELKDKSIYELVAEKQHPFLFPYNFHHQQISLGLAGKKPVLGELNYRVSLEVPATSPGTNAYGAVQANSDWAQVMMSGTGPEQQAIVLAPELPQSSPQVITKFFLDKYSSVYLGGGSYPVDPLKTFIEKTDLHSDAVESLLAIHGKTPYKSPNVTGQGAAYRHEPEAQGRADNEPITADKVAYGACYINGTSNLPPLALSEDEEEEKKLLNTSPDRYDRIQRMIRLQRWSGIGFAELDTLIMAIIRSEGILTNARLLLTRNTLRALGIYRYLRKHHTLEAEEFSAFFHQLSAYANEDRLPMFDRVFNNPAPFDTPLVLDAGAVWLTSGDSPSNKTLAQLCAALGLSFTRESLWPILIDTRDAYAESDNTFRRTLSMVSSMYRQTRIASLFGLTAEDNRALIDLLGGEPYRMTVVKGTLKTSEDGAPDVLDIVMQLDWAVSWLKETGRDVKTLRRLLALDTTEPTTSQALLDQLNQLGKDAVEASLKAEQLTSLNLPDKDDTGTPIDWWGVILKPLIDAHGLVMALPLNLLDDTTATIAELITAQLEPVTLEPDTKIAVGIQLGDFLFKGYVTQHRLMEGLLQSTAGLPLDRCETVMRWAATSADIFLGKVIDATAGAALSLPRPAINDEVIESLMTLHRYAEVNQLLGLSAQALRTFLVHPQWLHASLASPLPLSLTSFYVLDRYRDWRDTCGHPEAALLGYLVLANHNGTPAQCTPQMAWLMGWSTSELSAACTPLEGGIARSVHQVNWLIRMQRTSDLTGLGAGQILEATELTTESTVEQWKKVGDAVMGASR